MKSTMKILSAFLLCLLSLTALSQSEEATLEKALQNIPDVSFKKTSEASDPYLKFDLVIKQPLDHAHPEKGFFNQHLILTHKGFNSPTVMETQGYWLYSNPNEIEKIFSANNINIEYRFFGKSLPDSIQWQYLTVEQAMADLHTINQLFRKIYKGKWISTGISKGGSTTIYYKYFFPADVDLSIPYVAPLDNSLEDKRIYNFLDTMGTPDCRNKIKTFQIFLLKHEDEILEKLKWYSAGADIHYNYTGSIGKSFEYAVLEYSFSFWQYNDDCESIPTNNVVNDYIKALLKTSDISSFSDEGIKMFEGHYYQASTQCGYYGYNIESFKNYLYYFKSNPSASFPPATAVIKPYDPALNQNVQKWLQANGNNLLYIYGGSDTWSAAGITVSGNVNSKKFTIPNTNHATARIKNMSTAMQQQFAQAVKSITGLNVLLEAVK